MLWVRAIDLENWAKLVTSRYTVQELVRRLAYATVDDLSRVEFPSQEGAQRPGYDGIVSASKGDAHVPAGVSAWEIGVTGDIKGKADEDFDERTKNPLGLIPGETTYIFVTLRKWTAKAKWLKAKNALGIWKEVRVYDSADLEEWLEQAPAVDTWLAYLLKKRPSGVVDISTHWENLAAIANPHFTPVVFLASRDSEVEFLSTFLDGLSSVEAYEAGSPNDVIDFVAAYVASLEPAPRSSREARIVVVEQLDAWTSLASSIHALTLIPRPSLAVEPEMIAQALRSGHRVILCSERFANRGKKPRPLPRPHRYDLLRALLASGFDHERGERLSREARGNLTVLKRRGTSLPSNTQPTWSEPSSAVSLLPILLAGGWNDANESDRKVMEALSGTPYERVLETANQWLISADPPLLRVGAERSLASREDSWELLAPFLTRDYLDRFARVAVEVLGEDDPSYDLEPDKRWMANIYGKSPRFSGVLRKGIAETLALLGSKAESVTIHDAVSPASRAEKILGQLLPVQADWKRWASLSHHLPLLAEAAPRVFLELVERDLRGEEPQVIRLFDAEDTSSMGSSPHTQLLWALESLTWEATTFARTCLILANLAQNEPGGRLGNRPDRSLRGIFLPWFPQGMASVEERVQVFAQVMKKYPEAGWKLALTLLPNVYTHAEMIARPHWREWGVGWKRGVSESERSHQVNAVVDRLIANVGTGASRWVELISRFESFPKEAQDQILVRLEAFDQDQLDSGIQRKISETLREKIHRHREYPDAHWALPTQMVDKLDALQVAFEPRDLVDRHAWLFDRFVRLPHTVSWQERLAAVHRSQEEAITHLLADGGWPRILALAATVEDAHAVGFHAGRLALRSDGEVLPAFFTAEASSHRILAVGFMAGRFANGGWDWVEQLPLDTWPTQESGTFCLHLPFGRETWHYVERLGDDVSENYWARVMHEGFQLGQEDIEFMIGRLLNAKRPFQATVVIDHAMYSNTFLSPSRLMDVLEAGLVPRDELNGENLGNVGHSIHRLFERLQGDETTDQRRLAFLEWSYLPMFESIGISPKTLRNAVEENAEFFADLIKVAYSRRADRARHEDADDASEQEDTKGVTARLLLGSLHAMPGRSDDGSIDSEAISGWVEKARMLCKEANLLDACDSSIGVLIANAPAESDESWPCISVRDVIELIDNEHVLDGFGVGILRKRSSWTKSLTEGGAQEWALAKQYEDFAKQCDIGWPATARALRLVVLQYTLMAKSEDERLQRE